MSKYSSCIFYLTCAFLIALTVALFVGKITGGEFNAGEVPLAALYFGAKVMQKKWTTDEKVAG